MRAYVLMSKDEKFWGVGGWIEDVREARPFTATDILKLLRTFPKSKAAAIEVNMTYAPEPLTLDPRFETFSRMAA